jgi:regulator of sigma E protease
VNTPTWEKVLTQVDKAAPGASLTVAVQRAGATQKLTVKAPQNPDSTDSAVGYPALPAVADEIGIGSPAERAGMKADDQILSINGQPVVSWMQLLDQVRGSDGHSIHFVVRRDGQDLPFDITPAKMMDQDGQMAWQVGVQRKSEETYERQGFVQSIKDSGFATVTSIKGIGQVLAGLFSGKVSVRDLQTVVSISREAGRAAKRGPMPLIELMAIISLNLGLLNLLPIPILDGGHVLMLAIEGILRRDLSLAFKERFVQVGLVFLLGFFAFVMYNDILKVFQAHH